MKQVVTNYTFSTSGKTITLTDFNGSHPVDLKRLYLITDVTTNKILYNFADSTVATSTVSSNNIITLSTLQGGESNGDALQVIYDVVAGDPTYELPQTELTDGTNMANVLAPGTANSSGNALLTANTSQTVTFSYAAITAGTTYDVGNYRWVSVQVTSQYTSSTINFQASNDGTNWYNMGLSSSGTAVGSLSNNATSSGIIYHGPLAARYFRINVTGTYSSGTCAGVIVFSTSPGVLNAMGVLAGASSNNTTGSITTSSSSIVAAMGGGYGGFATVSIHGTYSGISFGITGSDDGGTTFYNVPIYDAAANAWLAPGSTITPGTNASKIYYVALLPGGTQIKVLASAYTSGTGNIRITYSQNALPGSTMSQIMDAAGNDRGANVDANGNLQVGQGTAANLNATVIGQATGAGIPSTSMPQGIQAITSEQATTTSGYNIIAVGDKVGKQIVLLNANPENFVSGVATATGTTSTLVISAPSGSLKVYITDIFVVNSGSTTVTVNIQNGFNSSTIATVIAPAGGGQSANIRTPIGTMTAATAVYFACSGSSTTVSVTVSGYLGV